MIGTPNIQSLRDFVQTREDATNTQQLFNNLSNKLFNESLSSDEILQKELTHKKLDALRKIVFDNGINIEDKTQMGEFLLMLKDTVDSLPTVHIMLAFEPEKSLLDSISEWFYVNIKRPVILDIVVDSTLIAGGIISFNGKVSDHSVNSEVLKLQLDDDK
jgi:F0F1-type ATP synthase delta subunit